MEFVDPIRSQKQIDNMKRFLKERSLRDWLLFTIGINSGLRISDLLQLTVEDVKDESRISIREQKTGKLKDFPLSDNSKRAISEYIKSEHLENGPLFPSRKANGSRGSGAISRQQAYQIINDAAREVGIKSKVGTHTLRKTFGYHAYKQGVSLEIIQKLLNHSAPSVTLRYIGITKEELDSVYISINL